MHVAEEPILRMDKYSIKIDDVIVTADIRQEERIRDLTPEQLQRFQRIMGSKK